MCGIAAIIQLKNSLPMAEQIAKMTEVIEHRGPDDEGYVLFSANGEPPLACGGKDTPEEAFSLDEPYTPKHRHILKIQGPCLGAMGHRRLSIVELSPKGHQPMCSHDGRIWITYNGEIYNFIEIRKELENFGYKFNTLSDTEVILYAWLQWGKECLNRFNGMFAFVLYDTKQNIVFAARDRFGVKPLYYWISPEGWIAFASEIKQFTLLNGWKAVWNPQKVYDYLIWGVTDHTEETLFEGVKQLKGGEYIEFKPGEGHLSITPRVWYEVKKQPFQGSFKEACLEYLDLLKDAVKLRLRADVEVGSCLSGGLDSSSIVCLVNEILESSSTRQSTFSACSHIKKFDEKYFIDEVISKVGVKAHYTYPCLESLFEDTRNIVWHQDEPFGSTSIFAQWHVFKKVRESKIKVMLDGQGADEQLGGYHSFFGNRFFDLFRAFDWMELVKEMRQTKSHHAHLFPSFMLLKALLPTGARQFINHNFRKPSVRPEWLEIKRLNASPVDPFSHLSCQKFIEQSELMLTQKSIPMLLHYEDRDSMGHSVESRTPFLDYRLVEFTLGLPSAFKLSKGWTKRVLRESMKGRLPESVRLRVDKLGFVTPEEVWLKENPASFRAVISKSIELSNGIINKKILKEVGLVIDGKRPFSFLPWRVICLGYWLERFQIQVQG